MRKLLVTLVFAGLTGGTARAQGPALAPPPPAMPPPPEAPPPAPRLEPAPPARGVHLHDGFYLRLGIGFGSYDESLKQDGASEESHVTGLASVGEIAVGGTIAPGLILGGGVWSSSLLASDRTIRGPMPPAEVIDSKADCSLVGPFVDWYFDPGKGLHLQAAFGFATVRGYSLDGETNTDEAAVGGGAMIGFGYEWWVSQQWSFGILGRLTGVLATGTDATGTRWLHGVGTSPSILFTATYN
jgi:hypothetical protein